MVELDAVSLRLQAIEANSTNTTVCRQQMNGLFHGARRCLNGTAPQYLAAHCVPVSATASTQHFRSAATASHQLVLVVPSYRCGTRYRDMYVSDLVHTIPVFGRLLKSTFLPCNAL